MDPEAMRRFAVERVEALFNRGEIDRIEEFVTPDFVNHEAWPGEDPGYEGFRLRMRRLHEAISDLRMEVHEVVADGDLVAYRATLSGTHTGPLLGIPATGRPFRVQHMHMLRMRDGRASEHWATRDDLGMLQQLGIIPGPQAPG
ncbi:MAG TPA: ester cyclase [Miltoncostaeaceae bacterium]|nr:ester cyclase [Miltoncostaeaceae bacterium]